MRENKTLENFDKACYALLRIDGKQFFGELCELGFKVEDSQEIVSWVKLIYEQKSHADSGAAFLSGKTSGVIKACLAYMGSRVLKPPCYFHLTQRRLSEYYDIRSDNTLRGNFRKFLKFLQQTDQHKFKVDPDLRKIPSGLLEKLREEDKRENLNDNSSTI